MPEQTSVVLISTKGYGQIFQELYLSVHVLLGTLAMNETKG